MRVARLWMHEGTHDSTQYGAGAVSSLARLSHKAVTLSHLMVFLRSPIEASSEAETCPAALSLEVNLMLMVAVSPLPAASAIVPFREWGRRFQR